MKKVLSIVVLSLLAVGLIMPVMAGAQNETIKECCAISQNVDIGDAAGSCSKGGIAAPNATAGAVCGTGALCPVAAGSENWGMYCLINTVYNVTNWLFYLMMIAVVIVFVIAAAMFMMAGGDVEKTKGAKGMMILGIVGLVIALIAKLVPSVVKLIVGM